MAGKLIKELWWEGNNLHTIDENDKHEVYENARAYDYRPNYEKSDAIETQTVTMHVQESNQARTLRRGVIQ
jgi:hypothetical protein